MSESKKTQNVPVPTVTLTKLLEKYNLPIRCEIYNPNPKMRRKNLNGIPIGNDRRDCSTRAICKLIDRPYFDVYDEQYKIAKKYAVKTNFMGVTLEILKKYGYEYCRAPKPVSILEFLLNYPKGKYILVMKGHIVTAIDGCIYDNFDEERIEFDFAALLGTRLMGWIYKKGEENNEQEVSTASRD